MYTVDQLKKAATTDLPNQAHRIDGRRLTRDQTWTLVRSFLDRYGEANHQIESFNQFVMELLPDIVQDTSPQVFVTPNPNPSILPDQPFSSLSPTAKIKALTEASTCTIDVFRVLPGVRVGYPTCSASDSNPVPITPQQAHIEKLTYFGPMTINVVHKKFVWHPERIPKPTQIYSKCESHCIGMLPIMVGSARCWTKHPARLGSVIHMKGNEMDPGGYFIVNGIEKVLISQEHMCQNMVNVFAKKQSGKDVLVAEIRSAKGELRGTASQFTLKTSKQYGLLLRPETNATNVSYVRGDVPLWILFRALGNSDDTFIENALGCLFYDTFDLELVRSKLENPIQDLEYAFKSFIDTNRQSADDHLHGSKNAIDAKRWMADRAHQHYPDPARKLANIENILIVHLLPHLNANKSASAKKYSLSQLDPNLKLDEETAKRKTMFIFQMLVRLWKVQTGLLAEDDRDSHSHKDFYASGTLIAQLFSQHYYKMLKDVRKYLSKCAKTGKPLSFGSGLKMKTITHGLLYAMSTGSWPNQKTAVPNTGVCQALNRLNRISILSHLRRLNTPIDKSNSRVMSPRQLHGRYFGFVCPNETPEGEPIGLVKNMAMSCLFTVDHDMGLIIHLLKDEKLKPYEMMLDWMKTLTVDTTDGDEERPTKRARTETNNFDWKTACLVSLNGFHLGFHPDGKQLCEKLKAYRKLGLIPYDTCILYNAKKMPELILKCEGGRQCRPLYVLKDRKIRLTEAELHKVVLSHSYRYGWDELLKSGTVEFVDALETENALIAEIPDDLVQKPFEWTHASLDPSLLIGVAASQIPFPDANQSPRNTYQSAMSKQAIPSAPYDADHRMENMSLQLWYPQKPLCMTRMAEELGGAEVPAGQNLITAIGCFGGGNIEDAIIINKSFIERGGGRSYILRAITVETKKHAANSYELFEKPNKDEVVGMKQTPYDGIDEDGLPIPGQTIYPEQVIVGKTQPGATADNVGSGVGAFEQNQYFEEPLAPSSASNHEKSYRDFLQEKARAEQSELTKRKCRSQVWNHHAAVVDKVAIANTAQGGRIIKARTREMHIPDTGDKLCITADHQVLTVSGWKNVADITLLDWVATLNPVTLEMSYRHPTNVYHYDNVKLLAVIQTPTVSQVTTLNHRLLVRFQDSDGPQFRTAANLYTETSQRRYPLGHVGVRHHPSRPMSLVTEEEHQAFHLWPFVIANADNVSVTEHGLLISDLSSEQVDLFAQGIAPFVTQWPVSIFPTNRDVLIQDQGVFSKWLSSEPRLPSYLFDLESDDVAMFIRYVAAHQKRLDRFVTSHQSLADDFQRLAIHAGRSAQLVPHLVAGTKRYYFEVAYSPSQWSDWTREEVNIVAHQAPVYCLEVPNHVFMVRRHGKASWTGNSSRHGQKGTIGIIYSQEDMPFDVQTGITPDIIVNPHAFVSRMTYGNIREDLLSLLAALQGKCSDGTPFQEYYSNVDPTTHAIPPELESVLDEVEVKYKILAGQSCLKTINKEEGDELVMDAVSRILRFYGYDPLGKSAMINGQTGKQMQARLFMAPCYYYFLKHLANQKMHARSRGPRQIITKQPAEGRARGGGLRFGEMERDTLIAHGASMSVVERLLYNSDLAKAHFCDKCGDLCIEEVLTDDRGHESVLIRCQSCPYASSTRGKFSNVFKVLGQDLQGLNYRFGVRVDKPPPFPVTTAKPLELTYSFFGYEGKIRAEMTAVDGKQDVQVVVDDRSLLVPRADMKVQFMNIDLMSNHYILACILSFYQVLSSAEGRRAHQRDLLNGVAFLPYVANDPDNFTIGRWKDYAFTWSA